MIEQTDPDEATGAYTPSAERREARAPRQDHVNGVPAARSVAHCPGMPTVLLTISWENTLGLIACVLLLAYLVYALIRAERF